MEPLGRAAASPDPARSLPGGFLTDAQGLAALASGAPVYTDDRPTLAYATAEAQSSDRLEEALVPVVRAIWPPWTGRSRPDHP